MKWAYLNCASELNNETDNLLIKNTITNYLVASFAFLYLNNNLASSIDWILYQNSKQLNYCNKILIK